MYFITVNNKDLSKICIEKFIDLLKLKNEGIISQTIICLRKLILQVSILFVNQSHNQHLTITR